MLRQKYMNKYKEKSLYDENRFLKEDDEYLLKESRPVKETFIKKLNPKKMNQFIDDILTDKKLTSILYATNADIEIKTYNKIKQNFESLKLEEERRRRIKNENISIVKKRNRREAYYQMRNEIDNYKLNQLNYHEMMKSNNFKRFLEMKKIIDNERKEKNSEIRRNRITGFRRAYNKIKEKLDHSKDHTAEIKIIETENKPSDVINLPEIKLNLGNVYSRLYNNAVLVTPISTRTKKLKVDKKNITKLRLKRPLTQQKTGKINTKIAPNPKITLTLKNALKSNNGKEFTINVTEQNINKCFTKYSGGPENIPFLNGKFEEKNNDINLDKFVDFYKLEEKNTGNSYLHLATIDNYPILVQYFLEKGANVNVQNYDGDTPLHIALRNKNNEIIKLLMERNPAMNIPNNKGDIAFELFSSQQKIDYHIDRLNIINPAKKDGFI